MKKISLIILTLVCSIFIASCTCCNFKSAPIAYDTEYVLDLKSLDDIEEMRVMPTQNVTLLLKKEANNQVKVSGCSGVNRYFGGAYLNEENQTLTFGQLGVTMMMGPGMEVEKEYLDELEDVVSYKVCPKTKKLMLLDDDNDVVLKFNVLTK